MKIDLHLHSEYSWDSQVPIETYVTLAKEMGIGAISITDHNNTESHQVIRELQEKTHVLLVPGQEINTLDGHLLIYGWIDTIPRDKSMIETVKIAKGNAKNGEVICIAAHPFDRLRSGKGKRVFDANIDGIEIINASALFEYFNWKAKRAAKGLKMIKLGNSDAHKKTEFAFAYSEIPDVNTVEELFLQLQNAIPMGRRIGLWRKSNRFIRRKLGRITE